MKIQIRLNAEDETRIELHFERRLPRFPCRRRRLGCMTWDECRFDRNTSLNALASQMTILNRGRYETELSDPRHTFRHLMERLIDAVPGVVSIEPLEPYAMAFQIGRCFEAEVVGRQLAEIVVEALWPDAFTTIQIVGAARADQSSDMS